MATAFLKDEDVVMTAFDLLKRTDILDGAANENINYVCGVLDLASAMLTKIRESFPNKKEEGE